MDAGSYLQGPTIRGQSALSLDQTDFCNSLSCSWRWQPIFTSDILQRDLIYISNIESERWKQSFLFLLYSRNSDVDTMTTQEMSLTVIKH